MSPRPALDTIPSIGSRRPAASGYDELTSDALLRASGAALLVTDRSGRILAASEGAAVVYGTTRDVLLTRDVAALTPGDGGGLLAERVAAVAAGGHGGVLETIQARRDGDHFVAVIDVRPVGLDQGASTGCVLYVRDETVSRQRQGDTALARALHRATSVGLCSFDARGTITHWNAGAEELTGLSEVEAVGRPLTTIGGGPTGAHWRRLIRRCAEGSEVPPHDAPARHRDGSARVLHLNATPLFDETGRVLGGAAILRDVTRSREAQQALEAAARRLEAHTGELAAKSAALERVNGELDRFVSIASHDLRAPLRGIDRLAHWLAEELGDHDGADVRRYLDLLRGRVQRLDRLICDLLTYARADRLDATVTVVDLSELVADVASLIAPREGIEVVARDGLPLLCTAQVPLRHVLHNLIDNAVKHHDRDRGTIEVSAADRGERVEIAVTDDGPGIPDHLRERAFQIFQTLKSRDEVEGSGMGLAFVRKIVRSAGGDIEVADAAPRGTTFRFTWPRDWPREDT